MTKRTITFSAKMTVVVDCDDAGKTPSVAVSEALQAAIKRIDEIEKRMASLGIALGDLTVKSIDDKVL